MAKIWHERMRLDLTYLGDGLGDDGWDKVAGLHVARVSHLRKTRSIVNHDSRWLNSRGNHFVLIY